ncbi:uncharacterized protein LOC131162734 [Malania oleifera]|uniref:uncharacterized protein LOC131162734 n=1 Tax=Malania oleifera TaxID=397392 RepID=UPI0025ADE89F|nr:uncharacterized protein LOC131162734 [Malania oleifera]
MHPPTFSGGHDPTIVGDWVEKIERILEVLHCTNKQRVLYATFQLSREAGQWWTTVSLLEKQRAGPIKMSWSCFKEVFFNAKADDFSTLTQGSMMVQGYATQYIELSWFALCLISNEYEKTRRFKKGLRKDICRLAGIVEEEEQGLRLPIEYRASGFSDELGG